MNDWYEDWTGQSEALTKFGTGNVSAASTAAAIVAKAKAEAEAKAKADAADERTWRDDPKYKKALEEAEKAKQASKPAASSYVAPAAAAPAAPAADAPKPAEEPWWSSTAAKAAAVGLGAGAITLALLRRK